MALWTLLYKVFNCACRRRAFQALYVGVVGADASRYICMVTLQTFNADRIPSLIRVLITDSSN
jgi:hypothetical protein